MGVMTLCHANEIVKHARYCIDDDIFGKCYYNTDDDIYGKCYYKTLWQQVVVWMYGVLILQ